MRPSAGPATWSACPHGAPSAVLTGIVSEAALHVEIRQYERAIDHHIAEAEARLCAADMSNIGRDEARQVRLLTDALRALQARLTGGA